MLEEDLEAVIHADALGFDDVWIGEHFSSMTEPITSPLMFLAKAIPLTKRVRLCTGVLNLPQQHPAVVAGFAAMFDHLANGRFLMGIGPGGLPSDFELFHLEDAHGPRQDDARIDRHHPQDLGRPSRPTTSRASSGRSARRSGTGPSSASATCPSPISSRIRRSRSPA